MNFWTEGNKIIDYKSLFRIDLQRKLLKMTNQIIKGQDIADSCYNYTYFIQDQNTAIQFITDYANEFANSLKKYNQSTGNVFVGVVNPLLVANLMALYAGQEASKENEYIAQHWDKKIALNFKTLDEIVKCFNERKIRQTEKTFTTKESLEQFSAEFLNKELSKLYETNHEMTLSQMIDAISCPVVSERTAKSILKNSYDKVAEIIVNRPVRLDNISTLIGSVVLENAKDVLREFVKDEIPFDKEFLPKLEKAVMSHEISSVSFSPKPVNTIEHTKTKGEKQL